MPGTPRQTALCKPVLVTGATGYIGGRLAPRLLEAGYRIRCLVREPANSATGRGPKARTSRSYAVTSMIPMRSARQWKAAAQHTTLCTR